MEIGLARCTNRRRSGPGLCGNLLLRLGRDFLEDEVPQPYWRTDIVQMTRYYMIEAARSGIRPSPRRAGFPV